MVVEGVVVYYNKVSLVESLLFYHIMMLCSAADNFFLNMKHIPLSGRNHVFQETLDVRPHLLILNKMDLADLSNKQVRSLAAVSGECCNLKHK